MLDYLLLLIGLALLIKGADYLIDGSSSLAKKLGISSLVIGLTIVALGTSLPELIVNVYASIEGNSELILGNIIGSNLFNLLLILGITAVIVPLSVQSSTTWKEIPFALLASVVLLVQANKSLFGAGKDVLTRADGIILLFLLAIFVYYVFQLMKTSNEVVTDIHKHSNMAIALMLFGGLAALFIGGRMTVGSAVNIARQLGISEFLISATVIAAGTSLPELITSIVAAMRKEMGISIGNIVGSNILNIFLILGISSLISPIRVPAGIAFDLIFLVFSSLLLLAFILMGKKHQLKRWQGAVFILLFISYMSAIMIRG
ncbi:MAG TPA: calcium/sodium antiporter [Candidatus Nanoarchaeia archaeon]|nr:calcium/sodium antiporter [Candidatus Nanoarchaeia archaeon]